MSEGESYAALDEQSQKWKRNYLSSVTFLKFFRLFVSGLFNLPGQSYSDQGLITGENAPQTWGAFITSWINALAGIFIGSALGLYIIYYFNLQDSPQVSWIMIGTSIAGAVMAQLIITIGVFTAVYFANYIGVRLILKSHAARSVIIFALYLVLVSYMMGYFIPLLGLIAAAVWIAVRLHTDLALLSPGIVGGVIFKVGGTLLFVVIVPAIKGFISGIVVRRIWQFLRGHDAETMTTREPDQATEMHKTEREVRQLRDRLPGHHPTD